MRSWLLPLFCAGCVSAGSVPRPLPDSLASREDGVDIRVQMVTADPSFEVTVANGAGEPISFAEADITVEDEAGRSLPVYAGAVQVAPGQVWRGALAQRTKEPSHLRGRLGLVMRGVRVGTRELEPQAFVFEITEPVAQVCPTPR